MKNKVKTSNAPGGSFFHVRMNGHLQPTAWGRNIYDVRMHLRSTYGRKVKLDITPLVSSK